MRLCADAGDASIKGVKNGSGVGAPDISVEIGQVSPCVEIRYQSRETVGSNVSPGGPVDVKDFFVVVHLALEEAGVDDVDDHVFELALGCELEGGEEEVVGD